MKKYTTTYLSRFAGVWCLLLLAAGINSLSGQSSVRALVTPQEIAGDSLVMLVADNANFGNFASLDNDNPNSRLVVSFAEAGETIHFGLSREYDLRGGALTGNASRYTLEVRKINPDGSLEAAAAYSTTIDDQNENVTGYADAIFGVYSDDFFFTTPDAGAYAIQFSDVQESRPDGPDVTIPYWDFTVTGTDGAVRPGRVWSRNWAFRTPVPEIERQIGTFCTWEREFNGQFFSYTDNGFVSRIDFEDSGFRGLTFSVAFNRTGPRISDDLAIARQSVAGNATSLANTAEHRVFLEDPDAVLFPSGDCGEAIVNGTFRCTEDNGFCLPIEVTQTGQVELILDFGGDGIADPDSIDVVLVTDFTDPTMLTQCIPWNGLRGDGVAATFQDSVDIIINYSQGVQHYSAFDVELLTEGFSVSTVRPACAASVIDTLYWDDRALDQSIVSGTGQPFDGRAGCVSRTDGCRTWSNFDLGLTAGQNCGNVRDASTTGYGNRVTLNTYWFANRVSLGLGRFPAIPAIVLGPQAICAGDTATLSVLDTLSEAGAITYLWEGPGGFTATTPTIDVTLPGQYCVTISRFGCSQRTCTNISVIGDDLDYYQPELSLCANTVGMLDSVGPSDLTYLWTPVTGISDPTSPNPTFNPLADTEYTVRITRTNADGTESCSTDETVNVFVFPDLNLQPGGGGDRCDSEILFTAATDVPATVVLTLQDGTVIDSVTTIGGGTPAMFDPQPVSGTTDYILIATDENGCMDVDSIRSLGGSVDIALADTLFNCDEDVFTLNVVNLDANDVLTYSWTPAELFAPGTATLANPTFIGGPGSYEVIVTASRGGECSATDTATVVVFPAQDDLVFTADVACDGRTVTFSDNLPESLDIVYDFGDGNTSTDTDPTNVYADLGTYTVTLMLDYDTLCISPFSLDVTVLERTLEAGFSADAGNCNEDGTATFRFTDATFNATGNALNYNWTFSGAGVSPTTSTDANPSVTAMESGTIIAVLNVNSGNGANDCDDTDTLLVNVTLLEITLRDTTICPGDEAGLNPGGDTGLSYTWSPAPDFDANAVNPVTSVAGTYSVTVTTEAEGLICPAIGTVTVTVADSIGLGVTGPGGIVIGDTDGDGDVDEDDAVDLNDDGVIDLGSITTCGEPVDLTVTIMTVDDVTVEFTDINGNPLGMGTSITIDPNVNDSIVITATNTIGCSERDTVVIINNQVNATIDVGIEGVSVCAAQDTSVSVINNDPEDELTYAWTPNDAINGPLSGETVSVTAPADGTVELEVVVSNQFGCIDTLTTTITTIPFTPNTYQDTMLACFQDMTTIMANEDAVDGYVYQWIPSEGLDLTDPANPVGIFTEDTDLMVVITDPVTMCTDTQTVSIDVTEPIELETTSTDSSICGSAEFTIAATVSDEDAIITYSDDRDFGNVIGTGPDFNFVVNEGTGDVTIYIRALNGNTGCEERDSVTVTYVPFMPVDYDDVVQACFDKSVTITSTGELNDNYTYQWTPADALDDATAANPTGVFTEDTELMVVVTDPATMCTDTQLVMVSVAEEVTVVANPVDTTLCEPGQLTVTGSSVNENLEYTWYSDADLENELATGPEFTIDATNVDQTITVYVLGRDPNAVIDCSEAVPVTVRVSGISVALPATEVAGCLGDRISLFPAGNVDGRYTYTYDPADLVDTADPANPVYVGTESMTVNVTATDAASNCSITTPVDVTVTTVGPLEGTAEDLVIVLGRDNVLTVTGCEDCDFTWTGPGDIDADGNMATVTPNEAGEEVTYTVTGTLNGCPATTTITFRVEDPVCTAERFFLPNAFSPNGDNMNDEIRVRVPLGFEEAIGEFRWIVYNRWGQEVFSSDNITETWDGKAGGDDLEPDVYGYWLRLVCPNEEPLIQQGNITILR